MAASIGRQLCLQTPSVNTLKTICKRFFVELKCTREFRQSLGQRLNRDSDGPTEIPVERLTVTYSRSSGAGGQHVNKVNTKAEVRFHVQTADWIPQDVKDKIQARNRTRINKVGELLVTSEVSRSQHRNLKDCMQKISAIIDEASRKPHEPSADDVALRQARLEKRDRERLKQKKIQASFKQSRRMDFD